MNAQHLPGERLPEDLIPVTDLWIDVAVALDTTPKRAASFVKRQFEMRRTAIYFEHSDGRFEATRLDITGVPIGAGLLNTLVDVVSEDRRVDTSLDDWRFLRVVKAEALEIWNHAVALRYYDPHDSVVPTTEALQWPWGAYETGLLRELAAAAERFWARFDPGDSTTASTNEDVSEWLKARGVSARAAGAIATILRADGLPAGRRPNH